MYKNLTIKNNTKSNPIIQNLKLKEQIKSQQEQKMTLKMLETGTSPTLNTSEEKFLKKEAIPTKPKSKKTEIISGKISSSTNISRARETLRKMPLLIPLIKVRSFLNSFIFKLMKKKLIFL